MMHFKEFFKTTLGKKPQSESGEEKVAGGAYDASNAGSAAAASAISQSAFGRKAPEPAPPPTDVSQGNGGSLASKVTGGLSRLRQMVGAD